MRPEPIADNIYSLIGFALVYLQSLERNIKMCTTFVLQEGEALDLARLQKLEESDRRKTLGLFARRIRERASLHPRFEELIERIVRDRNDLVHNMNAIPGWSLEDEAGAKVASEFVSLLIDRAHFLNEILMALSYDWTKQVGIEVPTSPELRACLQSVEQKYGNLIPTLFGHREA